jgi:hypothetical protein
MCVYFSTVKYTRLYISAQLNIHICIFQHNLSVYFSTVCLYFSTVCQYISAQSVCIFQRSLSVYFSAVCLYISAQSVCIFQRSLSVYFSTVSLYISAQSVCIFHGNRRLWISFSRSVASLRRKSSLWKITLSSPTKNNAISSYLRNLMKMEIHRMSETSGWI